MAETRQGLLPTGCPRTIVSGAQEIGKIYLCRVGHANEVSMTVCAMIVVVFVTVFSTLNFDILLDKI